MSKKFLSKTRLKRGLQCTKSLYFSLYRKDLEAPVDAGTQASMDEGNEIGERARAQEPAGVLIDFAPWEYEASAEATRQAIARGQTTLFEAAFIAGDLFARVDILRWHENAQAWDLIEVKKSTKVKADHIEDVALQHIVLQKTGLKLHRLYVRHLNSEAVHPDLENLFISVDVTDAVTECLGQLPSRVAELQQIAAQKTEITQAIGPQCTKPYPCAFQKHCWKDFPKPSLFDLPGIGEVKGWELMGQGKRLIEDLEVGDYPPKALRAVEIHLTQKTFVDASAIAQATADWAWPLYFLDFETLAPALPRYAGTKPYGEVPFQFSCHVQDSPGAGLRHFEYLHLDASDPRPALARHLVNNFGATGSIVAYSMGVEKGILLKLAESFPEHQVFLRDLAERLVDLLPVVRNHVYDAKFLGSFSIKKVAPALLGSQFAYDRLTVSDGLISRAIAEKFIRGQIPAAEAAALREALLVYCRQDTLAMAEIVRWLHSDLPLKKCG